MSEKRSSSAPQASTGCCHVDERPLRRFVTRLSIKPHPARFTTTLDEHGDGRFLTKSDPRNQKISPLSQ
jgi:hypothetical protein